ncbi:Bifunctional protein HldE [Streptomyces griseomycini]
MGEAVEAAVAAATDFVGAGGAGALPRPDAVPPPSDGDDPFALADRIRTAHGTVVAAGGCFDLLHAGHVGLLQAARGLGDCLVVCVNSDASVRRPQARAARSTRSPTGSARCAPWPASTPAARFEDTPERLLADLRPDVLVKGGDYAAADLPEAALLEEWAARRSSCRTWTAARRRGCWNARRRGRDDRTARPRGIPRPTSRALPTAGGRPPPAPRATPTTRDEGWRRPTAPRWTAALRRTGPAPDGRSRAGRWSRAGWEASASGRGPVAPGVGLESGRWSVRAGCRWAVRRPRSRAEVVAHHHPAPVSRTGRPALQRRNELLTAWLRRPVPYALARTGALAAEARGDDHARSALRGALARLPAALRERRPLPPHVERAARILEGRSA